MAAAVSAGGTEGGASREADQGAELEEAPDGDTRLRRHGGKATAGDHVHPDPDALAAHAAYRQCTGRRHGWRFVTVVRHVTVVF